MNMKLCGWSAARPVGAVSLLLLNGCFAYAPLRAELPSPGARVQVQLNTPQEVRAGEVTANDVVEIRGEVVSADSAQLLLSAFGLTSRSGIEHLASGQTTEVPRLNVAQIRQSRISPLRTGALAGMVIVGGVIFVTQVANPRGTPGGEGPGSGN